MAYSPAGRVSSKSLDGALTATATYDPSSRELSSVSYPSAINAG